MPQVAQQVRQVIFRRKRQSTETLRFYSQLFSVAINIWIGVQFYLWVRYIESGATTTPIERPPGVEGWLPISSLVSLRDWWHTGSINAVHPAGLVIFLVILATAFLFKKGFCGWICPVGFLSERIGDFGEGLLKHRLTPPRWLDWPLRSLKYILFGLFFYAVFIAMSPEAVTGFLYTDYNMVADVLMLRFFTDISMLALIVLVVLVALSIVVRGFWCRYLCPYGALLGLAGLVSPTRIKRVESSCTSCSACTIACPSRIKVEKRAEVVSDECIGCMACVDVCPARKTLEIKTVSKRWTISPRAWALSLLIFFWGSLFAAKMWGPWQNGIPTDKYVQMMPGVKSGAYRHP
ncbi:MAG: 4Fe-4S binding protein [candidate division Zixibacteria bacterium]|nr:4Fe-4S binding protein [candidate division Zixibacteria bacterium]